MLYQGKRKKKRSELTLSNLRCSNFWVAVRMSVKCEARKIKEKQERVKYTALCAYISRALNL